MSRALGAFASLLLLSSIEASVPQFEANIGQAESQYLFLARAGATQAWVDNAGIAFGPSADHTVRLSWLRVAPLSTNRADWVLENPTGNTSYYCNLPDSGLCYQPVPGFSRLKRLGLYQGIDWALHSRDSEFEYDLILHPGADITAARFRIEGAVAQIDATGGLHAGNVLFWRPEAFQWIDGKKVQVQAAVQEYASGEFGFVVGPHRAGLDLIVDPVIQSASVTGGSDEDAIAGTATSLSCSYRYGLTRSANWSHQSGSGRSVFAQLDRQSFGTQTVFWGGDGDSQVGGAHSDPVNCRLYLVGWTGAQNAPLRSAAYDTRTVRSYAGGASDGFFLEFAWGTLIYASYVGGPGADRLYDVRNTSPAGYTGPFALAGETDNPAWPGASIDQIGPGGQMDAVAALMNGPQLKLTVIGGSGDDRARSLRTASTGYWAIAGETQSSDFPSTGEPAMVSGKDLWIGRISADLTKAPLLRVFGGSGDETFGGLAVLPGAGIYLAGTTDSKDLPGARNPFGGGASDGFVAAFDSSTLTPAGTSYIGGSGRDEVAALASSGSELFAAASTGSADLVLPGLSSGDSVNGGMDGLFVICDANGVPSRGVRLGGSADDRLMSVEAVALGVAVVAGASESREWLNGLDPYALDTGGQDGFSLKLSFADLRLTPDSGIPPVPGDFYLGRDLQASVSIESISEPGGDGIVTVRSADPARLLISPSSDKPGTERILLSSIDSDYYGTRFVMQALSDAGEVDVVVEGRSSGSRTVYYPRQVLHVQLAPTALFLTSSRSAAQAVDYQVSANFFQAPLLPDGTAGPAENTRYGITNKPGLITSDPDGLPVLADSLAVESAGSFRAAALAKRPGTYTLTPSSTGFSAAPGQSLSVVVANTSRILPLQALLVRDTVGYISFNGNAGDTLRFSSDDPARLQIGTGSSATSGTATLNFASATLYQTLWLTGFGGDGNVTLRMEGTYRGKPVTEAAELRLVPYDVKFTGAASTITTGAYTYPALTLTPRISAEDRAYGDPLPGGIRPALLAALQLRSSDSDSVRVVTQASEITNRVFSVLAVRPGEAVLAFPPEVPAPFADLRIAIRVVDPQLNFGASVLRIPADGSLDVLSVAAYPYPSSNTLRNVRMRVTGDIPVSLRTAGGSGTDIIADATQTVTTLIANGGRAGQEGTLLVSAPAVPEFPIALRIAEPVYLPDVGEARIALPASGEPGSANLSFTAFMYDGGMALPANGRVYPKASLTLRPTVNPQGICTVPEKIEVFSGATVPVTCSRPGVVTVGLAPAPGVAAAQPRYTARVVSLPRAAVPVPFPSRVLTGLGLQTEMSLSSSGGVVFTGTITSSDPSRVRLSLDRNAPGTDSVTIPSSRAISTVFVQGFASDGAVALNARSTDGREATATVFLFPSTMAVRPRANDSSPADFSSTLSVALPLSSPDFDLDVRPYLVEADTKKLVWTQGLSIRAGTDPAFVRAQSSDTEIVQPVAPDALVSDGDAKGTLHFHAKRFGDANLSAVQPEGFIAVPDSSLAAHIYQQALAIYPVPVLSADLQTPVSVLAPGSGGSGVFVSGVTVTSLTPEKLVLSNSPAVPGSASVTTTGNQPIFLQALSGVMAGDRATLRMEGPGYAISSADVTFAPAELRVRSSYSSLPPLSTAQLQLGYGPLNSQGQVDFNGYFRPGVSLTLQVSSSDSDVIAVTFPFVPLNTVTAIPLRTGSPGSATLKVEAPPQITNKAQAVPLAVSPFTFPGPTVAPAARYLVSSFTLTNPRQQRTAITITSAGSAKARLGSSAAGAGLPSGTSLNVTLDAGEKRTLYLEPTAAGNVEIQLNAADFSPSTLSQYAQDPQVRFVQTGPLNLRVSGGSSAMTLNLSLNSTELPLGSSFGPLNIQVQSSNPQVVRVPATPVTFNAGDSRKDVLLQPVAAGDAVVSLIVPPAFAGAGPTRQDIVVSVR